MGWQTLTNPNAMKTEIEIIAIVAAVAVAIQILTLFFQ
jgi:hypothetical protein